MKPRCGRRPRGRTSALTSSRNVVLTDTSALDAAPDETRRDLDQTRRESCRRRRGARASPNPRITYFADWLALRANLGGVDFLRRAKVCLPTTGGPSMLEDL